MKLKYTKHKVEEAVSTSNTYTEIINKLDMGKSNWNFNRLKILIEEFGINDSHLLIKRKSIQSVGATLKNKKYIKPIEDIRNNFHVKNRLIKLRGSMCERCNLDHWMGETITLELHHINGKSNKPENLQLLCPNCHSLTPNWRGKK